MKPRILIIEDDLALRHALDLTLTGRGYELLSVSRPSQALALLEKLPFSLLLVDGILPESNGLGMIQRAREIGYSGEIIFMSARAEEICNPYTTRWMQEEMGVSSILQKPLDVHHLIETLEEVLQDELEELSQLIDDDELTQVASMGTFDESEPTRIVLRPMSANGFSDPMELPMMVRPKEPVKLPSSPKPFSEAVELPMKSKDVVERQLEQLRNKYHSQLEGSLLSLLELLGPARKERRAEALELAIQTAHSINGTSGTLGLHEVSDLLRQVEEDLLAIKREPGSRQWEPIFQNIERAMLSRSPML